MNDSRRAGREHPNLQGGFAPYLHEDETTPLEVVGRDPARARAARCTATARTRSSRRAAGWRTTGSTATA